MKEKAGRKSLFGRLLQTPGSNGGGLTMVVSVDIGGSKCIWIHFGDRISRFCQCFKSRGVEGEAMEETKDAFMGF